MKELLIATILTIAIFIATLFMPINNLVLQALVNFIPIIIPTFFMWRRVPRNYLRFMSLKSINIQYIFDIRMDSCLISKEHFIEARNNLLQLDPKRGEILKENIGDITMLAVLKINTAVVYLQYYNEEEVLMIKSESKVKYKLFFDLAKEFLREISLIFSNNTGICYNNKDLKIKLTIDFIDVDKTNPNIDMSNPFWGKLFDGFKNRVAEFKYKTNRGNTVLISNDIIEISGNNIDSISEDIKSELTLLSIKN